MTVSELKSQIDYLAKLKKSRIEAELKKIGIRLYKLPSGSKVMGRQKGKSIGLRSLSFGRWDNYFVLYHEIAHVIFQHSSRGKNKEKIADLFAFRVMRKKYKDAETLIRLTKYLR